MTLQTAENTHQAVSHGVTAFLRCLVDALLRSSQIWDEIQTETIADEVFGERSRWNAP